MRLEDKAFEAKTITFWNGGGRIYTEPVPLVELEDAEEEIETAQSTITSQAIQLERKDKEIQRLVGLLVAVDKVIIEPTMTYLPDSKIAKRYHEKINQALKEV